MTISTPTVFFPGTQCDERVWFAVWKQMDMADRRYVPLQWAESREQMLGMTKHTVGSDTVHLVGFSMGGFIASLYALEHPEQVASLTLVGYNPAGLTQADIKQRKQMAAALEKGRFRPMSDARQSQLLWRQGPHAEKAVAVNREMEHDLGGAVLKYHFQATSERPNLVSRLAATNITINLIAAEHDQIAPFADMQAVSQQLSASAFHQITASGHLSPLEQTAQVSAALNQLLA
ncbi:alpha/beta hydrolase [Alteromonas sediminis]|uniref:Alpha/beta hydrolase n=1 Tax=Alteromonas sediminis TaxID=2259342 RepID=A0A3N5Y4Y5_9ALTE|nr:alpha/beta hydrolase [Alteromonas sediminis]RPJ68006.1 alpha/beta hydrolase [Alteromonas sediminis]